MPVKLKFLKPVLSHVDEEAEIEVLKDGILYQIGEVTVSPGKVRLECYGVGEPEPLLVLLSEWCAAHQVNPLIAKNAAGRGSIPGAVKVGEGRRGVWKVPQDTRWRPAAKPGRTISENPSPSAKAHRKRKARDQARKVWQEHLAATGLTSPENLSRSELLTRLTQLVRRLGHAGTVYYLEAEESPPTQNRAGFYLLTPPADYWFLGEFPTEAGEGIAEFDTYKTFGHV